MANALTAIRGGAVVSNPFKERNQQQINAGINQVKRDGQNTTNIGQDWKEYQTFDNRRVSSTHHADHGIQSPRDCDAKEGFTVRRSVTPEEAVKRPNSATKKRMQEMKAKRQ